jgi:hypothetical protein
MRTTVTIDDELLAEVKQLAARSHRTIGAVLEDAIRKGLKAERPVTERKPLPDFQYAGGLQAGVDLYDREAMADVLYGESGHALS